MGSTDDPGVLARPSTHEILLREVWMTCSACPSQLEGVTEGGEYFYARYRFGRLTWGVGQTPEAAIEASIDQIRRGDGRVLGGEMDGEMDMTTMLRHVNARVRF